MNNKVNFLRGTSTEYESSTKDNDTFYYTTDDEKLYLGNKEITGGGITVDDTLSDTSEHPVQNKVINAALNSKANLSDIPTTLPADGGNADTIDGKRASDFALAENQFSEDYFSSQSGDIRTWIINYPSGGYGCNTDRAPNVTGFPLTGNILISWLKSVNTSNGFKYGTLQVRSMTQSGLPVYQCSVYNTGTYTECQKLCDGGNADTLDGLHATAFYPAKGANTAGIDYDTLITTGLFEVNGTSTEPTAHSPNGNNSDNNFYVLVYRHSSDRCTQVAISTRTDKSVYIRARANSTWGEWTSFFISNNPHITSITSTESTIHLKWLPVANATKYAVFKYNGTGTSYTVLSNNITDTEYTITGLTVGTEYNILVQAYINDAWTEFTAADHIIARTNAFSSGTAEVTTSNCPAGAWYGKYE